MKLQFKAMRNHGLPMPVYALPGDAGLDLRLDISKLYGERSVNEPQNYPLMLEPDTYLWLPTGFGVAIPEGYEGQVRGRSGLAFKQGVTVMHIGTIDSGYRGELHVALINHSKNISYLYHGERIAQLIIAPIAQCQPELVEALDDTVRSRDGFGSTGMK